MASRLSLSLDDHAAPVQGSSSGYWPAALGSLVCHGLAIAGILHGGLLAELSLRPPAPPRAKLAYRVIELAPWTPGPFRRPWEETVPSRPPNVTPLAIPAPALPVVNPAVPESLPRPAVPAAPIPQPAAPARVFQPPVPVERAAIAPKQILIQDAPRIDNLDRIQVPDLILTGALESSKLLPKPQPKVFSGAFPPGAPARRIVAPGIPAAEETPAIASGSPGTASQALRLISQSSQPVPLAPSIAVPVASTGAPPPGSGDPRGAGASQGGNAAAAGSSEPGSPSPAMPVPPPHPATTAVRMVRTGQADVVLEQSQSAIPGSAGLLPCRPVYSVYIPLDTPRDWVLQYCLPAAARPAEGVQGNVVQMVAPTPVAAPYATVIMRPVKLEFRPGMRYAFVRGEVSAAGRFEHLREGGPSGLKGIEPVLESLSQWEFLPAKKDGVPARVEVLLCIPSY